MREAKTEVEVDLHRNIGERTAAHKTNSKLRPDGRREGGRERTQIETVLIKIKLDSHREGGREREGGKHPKRWSKTTRRWCNQCDRSRERHEPSTGQRDVELVNGRVCAHKNPAVRTQLVCS